MNSDIKLTKEQSIILDHYDQNIYISAAPGSGKSTMLSYICDKLLQNINNNVMLITFTNKAAKNILGKCNNLDKTRIIGGTFHSIGYKLFKENNINKTICDENKKRLIVKNIFNIKDKEELDEKLKHIDKTKSTFPLISDDTVILYNNELQKYNLIDFDDIIINTTSLLSDLNFNIKNITHILVDELQDTSGQQLEMIKALQTRLKCKVIGVADDDQNIYSWRGSRQENVEDFIKIFNCKILNMGFNFRSATSIVECSKKLIIKNKKRLPKIIQAARTDIGTVRKYGCQHHLAEIDYVIGKCRQFSNDKITILYRNRMFKNHLEFELKRNRIDYQVNDMLDITDRTPIRVMMSCLRIASCVYDLYDLDQATKGLKGLGKTTVELIKTNSQNTTVILSILNLFKIKKMTNRLKSIKEIQDYFNTHLNSSLDMLVRFIERQFNPSFNFQPDMKSFLIDITSNYKISGEHIREIYNDLGLNAREEEKNENAKIELSTVHGYKGNEQEIVIVPWCQQFTTPKNGEIFNVEDERRLFYVAVTRARDKLFLTYSGIEPIFVKELEIL